MVIELPNSAQIDRHANYLNGNWHSKTKFIPLYKIYYFI